MNAGMVGAAASAATHAADAGKKVLTLADVGVLDQLVANFSTGRKLEIGMQMLNDARVVTTPEVRGPLRTILGALDGFTSGNENIAKTLDNVRTSIRQQLDNVDDIQNGYFGAGESPPDYSVVGAIRDNLNMLKSFGTFAQLGVT